MVSHGHVRKRDGLQWKSARDKHAAWITASLTFCSVPCAL
jgi:hypothetical protein